VRSLGDWLAWIEKLHPRTIELGLERVAAVLERMGLRHPPFTVLTVGGTNGKGSTVALCDAMLRAAGYRVGAYTSPHLIRYNERVRVDGVMATDAELTAAFERIEASRGQTPLTYFEYGTLAALDVLREKDVDIAVLEVGMGGRLDAVNAVDPVAAVVTSIGIDHTAWLGPDRESIGREKAGIFRENVPAVCGDADPPRSLLDAAREVGARLYLLGRDFEAEPATNGWNFRFGARVRTGLPYPRLRGAHQLRNAAAALAALETLTDRFPVTQAHIREGLVTAFVPGRFQVLPGAPTVVLDVAHNVEAARALAETLRQHRVAGRTLAVFGMLIDKPIAEVAAVMRPLIDEWHVAVLDGARAATAEQSVQALKQGGVDRPVACHAGAHAAFEAARHAAGAGDRIVVFGSFYTVGGILAHLDPAGSP